MGWGTLRRWAMGGIMGSSSATKSDADVKLEAVYLFPNISPCSYRDPRPARPLGASIAQHTTSSPYSPSASL
jgi:hypothetical protein